MKYIASSRSLRGPSDNIIERLEYSYGDAFPSISVIFGFTDDNSRLYGGRPRAYRVTDKDLHDLYDQGIGFDATLTNHVFTEDAYEDTLPLLKRIHRKGNGVVCTHDELARRVKEDFPDLTVRASMIKHCNTAEKIDKALQVYDYVTLPVYLSDNDILREISQKERVIIFANAGCAYSCKYHACYEVFSARIRGEPNKGYPCSSKMGEIKKPVYQEFDLSSPMYDGYEWFKWVPRNVTKALRGVKYFPASTAVSHSHIPEDSPERV